MNRFILRGEYMITRAQAHAEIAAALHFPVHYGNNLDALWDMISTMDAEVELTNPAFMLNSLGIYGCKLLQTFFEAAEKHPGFTFSIAL